MSLRQEGISASFSLDTNICRASLPSRHTVSKASFQLMPAYVDSKTNMFIILCSCIDNLQEIILGDVDLCQWLTKLFFF